MSDFLWLIPALPLAGFVVLLVAGRRLGDPLAGWVATGAVGASFVAVVATFAELVGRTPDERVLHLSLFEWIPAGRFSVSMGLLADPLSITMCLFITGVGALIHLYSIGYMKGDPRFSTFFMYLNLFVTAMLMLVLGDNLLLTFLGWEGVGACSYLLISFWYQEMPNAVAGKKAFVTNRIGDWGYMIAMFLTFVTVGSIGYLDIARFDGWAATTATAVAVLFFVGATGKSAQIPLFVWLPDAMAGPTPVSALIHAATMVTSGVYLLVRLNSVLVEAGWANDVIAWVGAITALLAATIALAQNDIKKVLAYSTVSQLGYLFLAVGTGNYVAAIFHMVTHAFFKALLFLGSGSVIHGMAHDQDMRHYGGLRKYMPITAATFIIGWLAIAGVPPFAGFWSKDEILAGAFEVEPFGKLLYVLGLVTALLTAFYMTRQVILTFFGSPRWTNTDAEGHEGAHADLEGEADVDHHHLTPDHVPHESPWTMTLPLVVLAGLAVLGGLLNLPFTNDLHFLEKWLEPVLAEHHALPGGSTLLVLGAIAVAIAIVGVIVGVRVYGGDDVDPGKLEPPVLRNGWYIDSTYAAFVAGPGRAFFRAVATFDRVVIDGTVNKIGETCRSIGTSVARVQTGQVRTYAVGIAAGAVIVAAYVVLRVQL